MIKKLLLLNPVERSGSVGTNRSFVVPPLGLGVVAGLTPEDWEVTIYDESVTRLHPDLLLQDWTAVGIGVMTPYANRAYTIGRELKKRGVPVIFGGNHPSVMPNEALSGGFADSVVIGEADSVWKQVIEDIENGRLRNKYHESAMSLVGIPERARKLFTSEYKMDAIFTSRGCLNSCEFCPGRTIYGKTYKVRAIDDVLKEWELLNHRLVYVVDDNFINSSPSHAQRAIDLCMRKTKRGISGIFFSMNCVTLAENPEAMAALRESGGRMVLIGFESLSPQALRRMNKTVNLDFAARIAGGDVAKAYRIAIRKLHDAGIAVIGSFLFGYDDEPEDIGRRTGEFIVESEMDSFGYYVLQPFPGTHLAERMRREGRLMLDDYPRDWARLGGKKLMICSSRKLDAFYEDVEQCVLIAGERLMSEAAIQKTRNIAGHEAARFCNDWNSNNVSTTRFL